MAAEKIPILEKIAAVDQNIRELWDALDEDELKYLKNDLFILNRWISSSRGSREEQEHYVLTVNEYYNKHFFSLAKDHSKLLWLLLCMCNYNPNKRVYHEWIGLGKKKTSNPKIKFVMEFYPDLNEREAILLANTMTDDEIKDIAERYEIAFKPAAKPKKKKG